MSPQETIAHYRITAKLGEGGMGEVWRATDTKLGRDVAIKILPEAFAQDADRMARFTREAQVLASLNHPNIAAIYGVEERAIVMELVEGETLHGPMPVEAALSIAKQIAEALEYAHERGVIHRDLKPANIKITPEGRVKVLDFGLAKALSNETTSGDPASSPTLTMRATVAGVIMGTAAYMSPEQARGQNVDRRADVWAFGVVLYELVTGEQLFAGATVSDTLAAVLRHEPDYERVPLAARRVVRLCTVKDPRQRMQAIGDARIAMEERSQVEDSRGTGPRHPGPRHWTWAVGGVLLLALAALSLVHFRETPPIAHTIRFQVPAPDKATYVEYPTISPDGRSLAFVAAIEGKSSIWVRPLDSPSAHSLAGTDGASFPFWSPDNRFIAFFLRRQLKKVDISGGPPQTLCDTEQPAGGSWNRDGTILVGGIGGSVRRVSAAGGVPTPVTTLDPASEIDQRWPQFLPDGRHFLFWLAARQRERSAVVLASLDDKPDSKERRRLLASDKFAAYSAGHLLFEREGVLMAQPFDLSRLQLQGEPVPLVQQIGQTTGVFGWMAFSVSTEGTLAYRIVSGLKSQLAWFDRSGKPLGKLGQPESQIAPRISPDQKRVAVGRFDQQGQQDIWLLELARDTVTRFTFSPANDALPVWSPHGDRIVFTSNRDGASDLYQKPSAGTASAEVVLRTPEAKLPSDWSSDGRYLLYYSNRPKTGWDIWMLPLEGDRKPVALLQTEFNETHAQFSPDMHWIAYQSDESGQPQIYVQGFPKSSVKIQVSPNGGNRPRWRHDGKELFYLSPDSKMMAVDVKATAATFEAGRPRELFQAHLASAPFVGAIYDVTADGQRFLINTAIEEVEGSPPITVIVNWIGALKK